MELLGIFTCLCICLSIFLTPCVGFQILEQSPHDEDAISVESIQFSLPTLPRKLRVLHNEVALPVRDLGAQVVSPSNNMENGKGDMSAYHKEEKVIKGSRSGTRQEWLEGMDTSEFFTMDYSRVKRRRPIHNKSLPVGP